MELLTAAIAEHLTVPAQDAPLSEPERATAISRLVQAFHRDSSFTTGDHGELVAALDGDAVREAARCLLTATPTG